MSHRYISYKLTYMKEVTQLLIAFDSIYCRSKMMYVINSIYLTLKNILCIIFM